MNPFRKTAFFICFLALLALPLTTWAQDDSPQAEDTQEEQASETQQADAPASVEKELTWKDDAPLGLKEMVVTAERSKVDLDQIPRAVSVVTGDEIKNGIMRTTPEALRMETGILVQRTNLGGGSPFIRGMVGNQILVLVDGIRMNNSTYRGGPNQYLNTIDPMFIERIEVVRGVSSVLYGSDAMGGVVNVITKRRKNYDSFFGMKGSLMGRASTAEREETGHAFLSMNISSHAGFAGAWSYRSFGDVDGGGNVGIQSPYGYDVEDFSGNLDFPITDKIVLQTGYQMDQAFDVPGFDPDNPLNQFDPQRRDLAYVKLIGEDLHDAVDGFEATASLHRQLEGRKKIKADTPEILQEDEDEVFTYHGGLKIESQIGRYIRFIWGGEYYRDEISSERTVTDLYSGESDSVTPQFADDSLFQSAAGYLELQVTPLYWMRIVPGVRYSWFQIDADLEDPVLGDVEVDSEIDDITWSAHMILDFATHHHLILGVARGFRVPSIDDLTKLGSEDGRFDIPNEELDPESVISYEAGYRVGHRNVRGSVFGYYTEMTDLIGREPSTYDGEDFIGEDEVNKNQNVGEAYLWGVEGDLALMLPPNWTLAGALSYTFGENKDDEKPLRRIPPLMGNAYLKYVSDDERFFVMPYMIFAGKQDRLSDGDKKDVRIPSGGTDAFVTYNLSVGFNFSSHIRLGLIGENLTDEKYKYHGSGLWEAGRNFKGYLEVHFDI